MKLGKYDLIVIGAGIAGLGVAASIIERSRHEGSGA